MSDYGESMKESISILDRILGTKSQEDGPQGSQGSSSEGSNVNDLTNLFHFLLLDKINIKPEIRDKLTKVYSIFRSTPVQAGVTPPAPAPAPPAPAPPVPTTSN